MGILASFKITFTAMFHIFLLGTLGFVLVRKSIISQEGLNVINKLVLRIFLPAFIFVRLVENFDFAIYKNWWMFPILSFVISGTGFFLGWAFLKLTKLKTDKREFLGLMAFSNTGYLPLVLVGKILPLSMAKEMYILIFLFLIGFNLTVWSVGVKILKNKKKKDKNNKLLEIFSPPVLGVLAAFVVVLLKVDALIPSIVIEPLRSLGDCLFPLALMIVGGNLAQMHLGKLVNRRALFNVIFLKQLFIPSLALLILVNIKLGFLVSLLILIETCMPPAVSLSIISRHYRTNDALISKGIFFGHLVSIFTIPLFLTLFWILMG